MFGAFRGGDDFTLRLTADDPVVWVICDALDVFMRIGLGQISCVADLTDEFQNLPTVRAERARMYLEAAQTEITGSTNASLGIYNVMVDQRYKIAYDVLQAIMQQAHAGKGGVWDRVPRAVSDQPLPRVEVTIKEIPE